MSVWKRVEKRRERGKGKVGLYFNAVCAGNFFLSLPLCDPAVAKVPAEAAVAGTTDDQLLRAEQRVR